MGAITALLTFATSDLSASATAKVTITANTGPHVFDVEVMSTPSERARGLMFRKSLPKDEGMLFDFGDATVIRMWMKNTYIPLDMLFMDASGRIVAITENAVPHSTEIISSGVPARYVLEIIGGSAARLGINIGAQATFDY